jgi:single-strand DNA-binding protein
MNKVTIIGRMVKDPELKFTPGNGTAVTTLTLAVDRRKKEDGADFIPVVVWGKQAENTAQYTTKGSLLAVAGRIQVRTYDAKDGSKRYVTEVVAEEVQFLSKANEAAEKPATNSYSSYDSEEMQPVDDGDIPFN